MDVKMEYVEGIKNRLRDIGDWAYNCRKRLDRAGIGVIVAGIGILCLRDFYYKAVPVSATLERYNQVVSEIDRFDNKRFTLREFEGYPELLKANLDSLAGLRVERDDLNSAATILERINVAKREEGVDNIAYFGMGMVLFGMIIPVGGDIVAGRVEKRRKTMRELGKGIVGKDD